LIQKIGFRPKQLLEFLLKGIRLRQTITLVSSRPTRPPPPRRPPPPGKVADGRSVLLIAPGSLANNLNLDNPFETT
jgi:hypothetical protein